MSYIIVNKLLEVQKFNLQKPNKENVKSVIEFQLLFDLKIEILINKHVEPIIDILSDFIKEILEKNKLLDKDEEINWPKFLS